LIDARSFSEYEQSHIPGAVNVDLMQFHWFDTSVKGLLEFERQTRLLFSNLGISPEMTVVFYDEKSGMSAARGVWLLLYFSHKKVTMLDGGMSEWIRAGHPVEKQTNPFRPSKFIGRPRREILASYVDVKDSIKDKNSVLIDARSQAEYDGSVYRAARAGHIPKALNIEWSSNIDGSKFRAPSELASLYQKIPRRSRVITYCQGGYRAANTFVALKQLGYRNVKMYLGSWGEWANRLDLPVER
jgi:thiosulfate/3-mercaptopyruvate sulfurtransferase